MRKLMMIAVVALGVAASARADTGLAVQKEFKGRVTNEMAASAPKNGYVAGPKEWAKLWKDWKLGKPPAIDWNNQVVMVVTSRGSRVTTRYSLTDEGDLRSRGDYTADLRTDTGYWFVVVPKKGVKTINGRKAEFEKPRPEEP
jgi:hypothetical protein